MFVQFKSLIWKQRLSPFSAPPLPPPGTTYGVFSWGLARGRLGTVPPSAPPVSRGRNGRFPPTIGGSTGPWCRCSDPGPPWRPRIRRRLQRRCFIDILLLTLGKRYSLHTGCYCNDNICTYAKQHPPYRLPHQFILSLAACVRCVLCTVYQTFIRVA